ncbi:MAG: M1 family peptidase [Rhodocyclaceae bacterium]|nr:M1 family peptidase [Rhodocyclaceae bacterium]
MSRPLMLMAIALLALPLLAWAMPHLELEVRLDPATRQFSAQATLSDPQGLKGVHLGQEFEITELKLDDQPAKSRRWRDGTRKIEIAYRGTLKPTPALDHREVLAQRGGTASPEGSFLPASSGWYPDPGALFTHRVTLHLPAGQKGLVPGTLVEESDTPQGYRAVFDFPHPADALELMAGPYVVSERSLKLADKTVRIRTWFHPELKDFAQAYLDDSARYLERYSKLIGPYPFGMFSVVSSPTPTGYGMPTLTYLGRDVIRLPFIRATSLGHEVLHNWWGNGVYPDWQSGNWSEGLTTFMADYAYKEEEGEAAAREMRLGWLRDYAAVPPSEDFALTDFRSRHHGIASIIGYGKAAMVFLMLRDRIGKDAFERGLKLFWQRHRFKTAGWRDLEAAFVEASGQPLREFFRTWVEQPGAPPFKGSDPDFRIWRRVDPQVFPPILREVFVAPKAAVVVTAAALIEPAQALSQRLLDAKAAPIGTILPAQGPLLIIGLSADIDGWLAKNGLPARPFPPRGTAQVWAGRDAKQRPYVVIAAQDAGALLALQRALPHYGRQSWLIFEGPRAADKGVWPPGEEKS